MRSSISLRVASSPRSTFESRSTARHRPTDTLVANLGRSVVVKAQRQSLLGSGPIARKRSRAPFADLEELEWLKWWFLDLGWIRPTRATSSSFKRRVVRG